MLKIRVIILLILSVTSTSLVTWHFATAGPSPTVNRIVTPGAIGPCSWFISLDGTTPLAQAMIGGLSVGVGDNVVGTAGQDMTTFLNSIYSSGETFCFSDQTFTFKTSWSPTLTNVLYQGGANTMWTIASGAAFSLINAGVLTNATFSGITFDGNAAGETGSAILLVMTNNANNHVSLSHITCRQSTSACADVHGSDIVLDTNHWINNVNSDHIHTEFITGMRVSNSWFRNCGDTALAMDSVSGVTVNGNTFQDCTHQLLTLSSFGNLQSQNVTITTNTFVQTAAHPSINMDLFGGTPNPAYEGVTINENTFSGTFASGQSDEVVTNNGRAVVITGNTFSMLTTDTASYELKVNTIHGLAITGNTFLNVATGKDTWFAGLTGFTVTGNNFFTANFGITFQSIQSATGQVIGNSFQIITNKIFFATGSLAPATDVLVINNVGSPVSSLNLGTPFSATPCASTACTVGIWNGTAAGPTEIGRAS